MIIYNVTAKVDWSIAQKWLEWMKESHIPDVLATGCFRSHQLARLLEVNEDDGPTYIIQFVADDQSKIDDYRTNFAPALREQTMQKWGDKFFAFRSLLEVVS